LNIVVVAAIIYEQNGVNVEQKYALEGMMAGSGAFPVLILTETHYFSFFYTGT
jgi:hypothetical protein